MYGTETNFHEFSRNLLSRRNYDLSYDEKEWRLIIRDKRKEAVFRESPMVFTPYYKQCICTAINEITVGPADSDYNYISQPVEFLLSCNDHSNITLRKSVIPYR